MNSRLVNNAIVMMIVGLSLSMPVVYAAEATSSLTDQLVSLAVQKVDATLVPALHKDKEPPTSAQLPAKKAKLLNIQQWYAIDGTPVYYVAAPELPMVDIQLGFAAGSARDGEMPGIANLTATMLNQGTARLTANAVAEALAKTGAQYNASVTKDMAVISLRSLTRAESLQPAVQLLNDILQQPRFAEQDFKREQAAVLQTLQYQQQSPGDIAENAFYQALYGEQPYGHPVLGTSTSVAQLTAKQLRAFYQQHFTTHNAVLTIVGAVSQEQAHTLAETVLKGLPHGQKLQPITPAKRQAITATHIDYPSEQTHVYLGAMGISREDPDYFALLVGNNILGGSMSVSRLYKQIRDQRGLSYHVYSYFLPLAGNGPFLLGLQTRNEKVQQAVSVATAAVQDFITGGCTEEELSSAKRNIVGGLPLSMASNADISSRVLMLAFYGLPLDYYDTAVDKITNITREQVQTAFNNKLGQQHLLLVTVGRRTNHAAS